MSHLKEDRSASDFKNDQDRIIPVYNNRRVFIGAGILCLFFICAGIFFYLYQHQQVHLNVKDDLTTITKLKIEQITQWRQERLADANFMVESIFYAEGVKQWMTSPSTELEAKVRSRLEVLKENHPYQDIILVDTAGNILLSIGDSHLIHHDVLNGIKAAFQLHKAVMVDFHQDPNNGHPHLDVIAPMYAVENKLAKPVAAIIFSIDPQANLYPLIQSWPTPNQTAETLIVRRQDDTVLFLSNLKYLQDSALKLQISLSQTEVPAVKAVTGSRGLFEGKDYRGEKVLSVVEPIPDSPWFIVAKIDQQEVFSGLYLTGGLIFGLVLGVILIALMFSLFLLQRRQKTALGILYQAKIKHEALLKHFEYLVMNANDMIFLIDEKRRIVEANNRALEVYEYSKEEMVSLSLADIIAPDQLPSNDEQLKYLLETGFCLCESRHITKKGIVFPVEISAVFITVEGIKYIQWIVRDITERKMTQEVLINARNVLEKKVEERTVELSRLNQQLTTYANKLINIQEEEKKRIAQDLHDQVGQTLTALKMMLNQAARTQSTLYLDILEEAQETLRDLMRQVREMSLNLRPSMLDDLGLLPALKWHIDSYQNQTKIKIHFEHRGLPDLLPPEINIAAYRIIQEALTNVARYANVNEVIVQVNLDANILSLLIEDHGSGFDISQITTKNRFGLDGMKERARVLGGDVTIDSWIGKGTTITARIPVNH